MLEALVFGWQSLVQDMALALDGKAKRLDEGSEEANNDPNGYRDSRAATDSSHEGGGDKVRMDRERVRHSLGPLPRPLLALPHKWKVHVVTEQLGCNSVRISRKWYCVPRVNIPDQPRPVA